jgi:ABC-type uncharacterized transport system auxiliary subunit
MANLLTLMLTGAKSDKADTFRTRVVDETGVPGKFGEESPWSRITSSAPNASANEDICLERSRSEVVAKAIWEQPTIRSHNLHRTKLPQ